MKLHKIQKPIRKNLLADALQRGGIVANNGNMTVVFVPTINGNGHFALSYAGNEKFSRKYGEYVALDRLSFGECLPITEDDFYLFINALGLRIRENDPPQNTPPKSNPAKSWPMNTGARPFPT